MELINFRLSGRFAHFLRAEASASAVSYPLPPRTAILGVLGAILGLSKDEPQVVLEPANIAISGRLPNTHWHRAKFRKDPPASLPCTVKRTQKADATTKPEKATLILQEWLFNPAYAIWVSIPDPYQKDLEERLKKRQWHFGPCLGLSEMSADIQYLKSSECRPLPSGTYNIQSVFQRDAGAFKVEKALNGELFVQLLSMPRSVTPERVFSHCAYVVEREAKPIPVQTDQAYEVDGEIVMFL